jgi:hypothetical protein
MTTQLVKEMGDAVVSTVKQAIGKVAEGLKTQFKAFDARLAELEAWAKSLPPPKDGKDGRDGLDGKDGAPGNDGVNGADGADGAPGRDGIDGAVGKDGAPGADGANGADGKDGAPGKDGIDGANGTNGIDGKDGRDGIDGKDGAPGRDGVDGKDGISVDITAIEAEVSRRVEAKLAEFKQPADGRDGRDGKQGSAGRDALSIDIMPAIDVTRSYATGTFAKHAGGLWRAVRGTDGMDGWDCVVEGVKSIIVEHTAEREFTFVETRSSGAETRTSVKLPVVLYRGVFSDGRTYEKSDQVTWGGSQWIAATDAPEGKPMDGSKSWQLACKKGRDASRDVVRLQR